MGNLHKFFHACQIALSLTSSALSKNWGNPTIRLMLLSHADDKPSPWLVDESRDVGATGC